MDTGQGSCSGAKPGPHFLEREVGAPPFGTANPDPRGDEVMIQFGTGKVDFADSSR